MADDVDTVRLRPEKSSESRVVGRYRLIERLGRGGMGEVWLAEDPALGRRIALKLLHEVDRHDQSSRHRFIREARAAATLNDPRIAGVYDVGEHEGVLFIAMELVDGRTLGAMLDERSALPPGEVERIAVGIAGGLACAHAAGIVHRDIKPENIMIGRDGGVKILDFGIARSIDPRTFDDAAVTHRNALIGTPGYMAPERLLANDADPRGDVYAFGVILYELLTGARLFAGDSATLVERTRVRPTAIDKLVPAVSPELAAVIERCLAPDPSERFASAETVLEALSRSGTHPERTAARRPAPSRWLWSIAALAMFATVTVLALAMHRTRSHEPASVATIPHVSEDPGAQARFVAAVQAYYDGDYAAAARALAPLRTGTHPAIVDAVSAVMAVPAGVIGDPIVLAQSALAAAHDRDELARLIARAFVTRSQAELAKLGQDLDAYVAQHPDDFFGLALIDDAIHFALSLRAAREAGLTERLVAVDDSVPLATLARAEFLVDQRRYDEALKLLDASELRFPGIVQIPYLRAVAAYRVGDDAAAKAGLVKAVRMRPDDLPARSLLLEVLLVRGDETERLAQVREVREGAMLPNVRGTILIRHLHQLLARGRVHEADALWDDAIADLREAKAGKDLVDAHIYRPDNEVVLGRPHEVEVDVDRMKELLADPMFVDLSHNLLLGGHVMARAELALLHDDLDDARARIEAVAELDEHDFPTWFGRARTVAMLRAELAAREGHFDDADREAAKAELAGWLRSFEVPLEIARAAARRDDPSAERRFRALADRKAECLALTLDFAQPCRTAIVEALTTLAERAVRAGDLASARRRLEEVHAIWTRPDADLPVMQRVRAAEAALTR